MARCTNCQYKFSTKELLAVSVAIHGKGKTCPNCGVKQYMSRKSQFYLSFGNISLLFVLILPFVIKLSDKEETIW
ncbi:hypothetical protein RSA42_14935 [Exiguobacterium indicum]|uniref:hypothetical protein n=1 Tax=Exiguobacterium indicum TaxID=296995 RepID=UPI000737A956|nr:hypothetical protein [Exiguobacterium indicum]KTR58574.1 hypothetical protein RSA42_14935 [Exiguobacterium indicum]